MNDSYAPLDEKTCELLDLYAVGALDVEETQRVEHIISTSEQARAYVDEALSVMAQFEDNAPHSPELLSSIKTQLHSEASNVIPLSPRRNYVTAFIAGAVAASVAALVISSFTSTTPSTPSASSPQQMMENFTAAADTEKVQLTDVDGEKGAQVMMHQTGDILIDGRSLPKLDESSTYQLWAVVDTQNGSQVISAGVLGNNPGVYLSRVAGNVTAFALTKEVSGGVEKSSQDPAFSAAVA